MRFEERRIDDVLVVDVLDNRVVLETAPRFRAQLESYINGGNRSIVLNLGAVSFMDSSGLGALVGSLKALGSDGDLVLCGTTGAVASMFKLTRMDKVFRMYPSVEEAVASLAGAGEAVLAVH